MWDINIQQSDEQSHNSLLEGMHLLLFADNHMKSQPYNASGEGIWLNYDTLSGMQYFVKQQWEVAWQHTKQK